jgi:hypothetical protein
MLIFDSDKSLEKIKSHLIDNKGPKKTSHILELCFKNKSFILGVLLFIMSVIFIGTNQPFVTLWYLISFICIFIFFYKFYVFTSEKYNSYINSPIASLNT